MLQRIIVCQAVNTRMSGSYYSVQLIETYCESSLGGGRMDQQITWYDDLTRDEATDVLEAIASGPMVGDALVVRSAQLSLL